MGEEQGLSACKCGARPLSATTNRMTGISWVSCTRCDREIGSNTIAEATEAWNAWNTRSEALQPVSVKGEEDLGSVGSGLTPLVPSREVVGVVATPSMADLVPGFADFMAGLAAHLEEHAPDFVAECERAMIAAAPPTDCQTPGGAK